MQWLKADTLFIIILKLKKNLKGFGRENASDNDGGAGDAPSHVLQRAMVKRVRTVQASV